MWTAQETANLTIMFVESENSNFGAYVMLDLISQLSDRGINMRRLFVTENDGPEAVLNILKVQGSIC